MELGAIVCTPTSPSCLLCPVREHCRAYLDGTQKELPVKTKKNHNKDLPMAVGVFVTEDDKVLISKRPDTGLLAKLWEFPNVEVVKESLSPNEQLQLYVRDKYKVDASVSDVIGTLQHVFSHLTWNITVFTGRIYNESNVLGDNVQLVTMEELEQYAFPVSHQKIWKQYLDDRKTCLKKALF
jgi:A/G-specific adenine glycosylase